MDDRPPRASPTADFTSAQLSGGESTPAAQPATGPGPLLLLGVGCGLALGAGELLLFTVVLRNRAEALTESTAVLLLFLPLSATLALSLTALLYSAGAARWPRRFTWVRLAWLLLALSAFDVIHSSPRIAWPAAAVLAVGLGYQVSKLAARFRRPIEWVLRRAVPPGLALLVLAGLNLRVAPRWRESRALAALPAATPGAPNVLLIILDTVRSWDLSLYGYPRPTTPVLNRLAASGALFTRAVSPAPWTLPSHASMFTGRWPHELSAGWVDPLDDRFPTLAEEFAGQGYATVGIVGNVRYCGSSTGLARGFSRYVDYDVSLHRIREYSLLGLAWSLLGPRPTYASGTADEKVRDARAVDSTFVSWLDARNDPTAARPFFAFLNYFDAHRPYTSPPDFQQRFATPGVPRQPNLQPRGGPRRAWDPVKIQGSRDAYDASIAYIDSELGALLDSLRARHVLDNTIVVITSDHGEEFAEHGVIGHGNSLALAEVMVPLLVLAPGRVPAGLRITAPVSTREVARTLTDMAGIPQASAIPGPSLARFWNADSSVADSPSTVLSEVDVSLNQPDWYPVMQGPLDALVAGRWRYVYSAAGPDALYDFETDSLEEHDLLPTDSGRVIGTSLRKRIETLTGFAARRQSRP